MGGWESVAAAGDQKNGDDDQPNPVVLKKIAEAVVHGLSSVIEIDIEAADSFCRPSVIIICERARKVTAFAGLG